MDSTWMDAPFTPENGSNLLPNESDSSESQIIEQILSINKLMEKCTCLNKKGSRNSKQDSSLNHNNDNRRKNPMNPNNCQEERSAENGGQEIHLQVMSKSYSCLEGKTVSSSTTVLKIRSKAAMKKTESGNSKFSGTESSTEKDATSSERSLNEKNHVLKDVADIENRLGRLASRKGQWRICFSSKQEENKVPRKETQNVEDRNTEEALFSCPFELVEIYSSRKGKDEMGDDSKRFNQITKNKNSMSSFPKEYNDSNNLECIKKNDELDAVLQKGILKNNSLKPTQDQELHIDVDSSGDVTLEEDKDTNSGHFSRVKKTCVEKTMNIMDDNEVREKFEELRHLRIFNTSEIITSPVCESEVRALESEKSNANNNVCQTLENVHILKRSKRIHDVVSKVKEEQCFGMTEKRIVDEEVQEVLPTIEEGDPKEKYDSENLRLDLYGSEICERNPVNEPDTSSSGESKASKLSLKSDTSCISKGSKSELSSIENTIDLKVKDSTFVQQNSDSKSSKENNMKIVIEKRENKKYYNNKQCNENVRSLTINDNKKERVPPFRDPRKAVTKLEIDNLKHEASVQDSRKININWDDINICKMLTRIHERLTYDWQRMERLRMKLQNTTSVDPDKSIITLQLLDKTIVRCKSYIHGASDSSQAESKIGKLLSKYIIELVRIVNENKITLGNQERRVEQMHLETPQGQHAARKRSILNEIILTSDYWTSNISCSIEVISRLVKNVVADNEEKENVKSPRRYRLMQRHMSSNIPVNDTKQKIGSARSKFAKTNLAKKESTIETEMSAVSNATNSLKQSKSKIFVKHSPRSPEKDKHQDSVQTSTADRKGVDNSRHIEKGKSLKKVIANTNSNQYKQSTSRHKHRAPSIPLPAWRPGGVVKIPSSSSATVMNQRLRSSIHTREKAYLENIKTQGNKRGTSMDHIDLKKNLMNVEKVAEDNSKRVPRMHYTMEEKHGRKIGDVKRKPSTESCSTKHMPTLDPNNYKITVKRSDESIKSSPRLKSRAKALKLPSKNRSESLHHTLGHAYPKNYENASLCDVIDQNISKESKTFQKFEEIIKGSADNDGDKNHQNPILCYQIPTDRSVSFKTMDETTLKKEELQINEEEPTRDVDSKQYKNSQLQNIDKFPDHKLVEKLPERPFFRDVESIGISVNFDNSQPRDPSFVCVASASCMANFQSSSDYVTKPDISKCCQTSLISPSIIFHEQQEDEDEDEEEEKKNDSKAYPMDCNDSRDKYEDTVASSKTGNSTQHIKKERSKMNCHAASLSMLKDFLCDQGIGVDLVNRAEKYLKDKQKTQKCLKKKSISFADMPSNVEDSQQLLTKSKEELISAKNLGKISGNSEEDTDKVSLRSARKNRDTSTYTWTNSNNVCSQTGVHTTVSKSLQTIPENDSLPVTLHTMETQTEVAEAKHVASECDRKEARNEGINACSMTESLAVSDNFTETASISFSSKSVSTDPENCPNKQLKEMFCKKSNDVSPKRNKSENNSTSLQAKSIQTSNSINVQSTNKKIEEYKNSSKIYSQMFKQLLSQVYEECNESSISYGNIDIENELHFDESNVSLSCNSTSSTSSKSTIDCNCNKILANEEIYCPVRGVTSEIAAALRVAAIKAHNVYRAIDIYKRKLSKRLRNLDKRTRRRWKNNKDCRAFKPGPRNFSKSGSVVKILMQRKDHKSGGDVIEVCKVLREKEIASMSSKTSFDLYDESEEEAFESVRTTLTGTISSSKTNISNLELKVSRKSSSTVVLRDVTSLMKFLVNDIDNVTTERMESVGTVSKDSNVCLKFNGSDKVKDRKIERRFSFFSRENLLPVVYGIVCSIVFWCLRFTINCEVVS